MPLQGAEVFLTAWITRSALGRTYTIKTFAGGGLPNNTPGTSGNLSPQRGAVDAAGNVFFTGINVTRMPTLVARNGAVGFSGDNGAATSASFGFMLDMAERKR